MHASHVVSHAARTLPTVEAPVLYATKVPPTHQTFVSTAVHLSVSPFTYIDLFGLLVADQSRSSCAGKAWPETEISFK